MLASGDPFGVPIRLVFGTASRQDLGIRRALKEELERMIDRVDDGGRTGLSGGRGLRVAGTRNDQFGMGLLSAMLQREGNFDEATFTAAAAAGSAAVVTVSEPATKCRKIRPVSSDEHEIERRRNNGTEKKR